MHGIIIGFCAAIAEVNGMRKEKGTMQELTLKGLIKALHRCAKHGGCDYCPYYNSGNDDEGCINAIMEDAAEWLELLVLPEGSANNGN